MRSGSLSCYDRRCEGNIMSQIKFGRFNSVTEAIAYAEGAGNQGPMTLGSDGSITNQFGQVMGYDSDGNLAPTGKVAETEPNSGGSTSSEYENQNPEETDGPSGLSAPLFDLLIGSESGMILIQQVSNLDINYILETISEDQAATILNKFSNDPEFNTWVETITKTEQNSVQSETPSDQTDAAKQGPEDETKEDPAGVPQNGIGDNPPLEEDRGSALSEDEFNIYFNAPSGEALVSILQKSDLGRIAEEISMEQESSILSKFGADEYFASYVQAVLGIDIRVSTLQGPKEETFFGVGGSVELVGVSANEIPPDLLG